MVDFTAQKAHKESGSTMATMRIALYAGLAVMAL